MPSDLSGDGQRPLSENKQ